MFLVLGLIVIKAASKTLQIQTTVNGCAVLIVVTQNILVRWGERADATAPLQSSTFKYFVVRLVLSAANELLLVSLRSAFNKI